MRLLRRKDDGNFSLTEFFGNDIPRYAILSHTWAADDAEVTFKELSEGKGNAKDGYKKIEFCSDQAARDGLIYCWVDTCCIDKTSSAELTEAINSMFAWYRNADKCYVYLSDVSTSPSNSGSLALRQSRWFTRGWTLQELIAPNSVEFFSVEGQLLGTKSSMVDELHHITQISTKALQGGSRQSLDDMAIEERMSWIAQRQTKRGEDAAYSLLGIFNVHMPLIYGEGRDNAFARLEKTINEESPRRSQWRKQKLRNVSFSTVPFAPDPDFVDRPELLSWIRDKLANPGARAALVGLGGIGKSQLAIQYAHEVRNATPNKFVFWVNAASRARFEHAYRGIAERLLLPGRNDPDQDVLKLVSDWLCDETNGEWTMVLDNVDSLDTFSSKSTAEPDTCTGRSLSDYLPQSCNGSLLITSRNKDASYRLVGTYGRIKEVHPMGEHESLQLLRTKLGDTVSDANAVELLDALGHMPIAISQAAAYINHRTHMTIPIYLKELQANGKKKESLLNWDAGDLRRDESASNSVIAIFQMSFERVRQERPSAADLLSLMSFFNPQGIPEPVLRRAMRSAVEKDDQKDTDDEFDADLDLLRAYCLVAATNGTDMCDIHALVQVCMQFWLSSLGDVKHRQRIFVGLMAREFPDGTYENWKKCQQLLPHLEPLFVSEPADDDSTKAWSQLLTNVAWYMRSQGSCHRAQNLAAKALTAHERLFGRDDEVTIASVNNLALALEAQGEYDEAEELFQRAFTARCNLYGQDHELTILSLNNLAGVFQSQGKFESAGMLHRRALEFRERKQGGQHCETLRTVSDLAMALHAQGKYAEAEKLHRQTLQGRSDILGVLHPDTLSSINNLGGVLQAQGKSVEAEAFYRQAVESRRELLGEQHPSTLTSLSNLASVLIDLKKYEEAERISRQVLERRQEAGEQHPDTLTSISIVARVLKEQGKYEESEDFNRRALMERKRSLGEQHPDTLTSMNNLAHVLAELKRYEEAADYFEKAYKGFEQSLGPQHPWTRVCHDSFVAMQHEVERARRRPNESIFSRLKLRMSRRI